MSPLSCHLPSMSETKKEGALRDYRTTAVGIHILRRDRDRNRPVVHSSHCILTSKQLEVFLQTEFKRLAQEAGVKGGRIHVERAVAGTTSRSCARFRRSCSICEETRSLSESLSRFTGRIQTDGCIVAPSLDRKSVV